MWGASFNAEAWLDLGAAVPATNTGGKFDVGVQPPGYEHVRTAVDLGSRRMALQRQRMLSWPLVRLCVTLAALHEQAADVALGVVGRRSGRAGDLQRCFDAEGLSRGAPVAWRAARAERKVA